MKKLGLLTIILLVAIALVWGQSGGDDAKLKSLLAITQKKVAEAKVFYRAGEFEKCANSYTEAIAPFLEITDPKEVAATEETLKLLYALRAAAQMGAKKPNLADADYKKVIEYHWTKAKDVFEKRKTVPKSNQTLFEIHLDITVRHILEIFQTNEKRNKVYAAVFNQESNQNLISETQKTEANQILKTALLKLGELHTESYLAQKEYYKSMRALENLNMLIERFPNEIEAYKLRESVYRQRGNNELADADLTKIKSLQK